MTSGPDWSYTGPSTVIYPCDKGTGTPMGFHHYEAGPTGIVCCRYCGQKANR